MAELLLTMLLGWYGFGLLAGLVLLGAQLVGRARRGARGRQAAGRLDLAEPIQSGAAPASGAGPRELRPQQPAGSRLDAVAERRAG